MYNFTEGEIILIDKPLEWSSFDVVKYIKPAIIDYEEYRTGIRNKNIKIGHAGTLDPLATGLLIICTGKKTKEIQTIQSLPKTYTGAFFIGATTPSFDKETPVHHIYPTEHIKQQDIFHTAKSFIGTQLQTPPIYSAININGKRAYDLARKNKPIPSPITAKPIEIYQFNITKINFPLIYFEIECSKGTYIRSIAKDFGEKLNSGAYLHELKREKIGHYQINQAHQVKNFVDTLKKETLKNIIK